MKIIRALLCFQIVFGFTVSNAQPTPSPSYKQSITTAWGNYINTNIYAKGDMLLQVSIEGQNSVWHGIFAINGTNSWTPDITWNNVKLIAYSGYNAGPDDMQAMIISEVPSTTFGNIYIMLKAGLPVSGTAVVTVTATGANAASLALSTSSTSTYYTVTSSAGTFNSWSVNNKVGIGTIDPKTLLDVGGELRLGKLTSFPAEGSIIEADWANYIVGDVHTVSGLKMGVSNDGYTRAEVFLDNSNRPDGTISFKTANGSGGALTRMFINGDGQVGIGTTKISDNAYALFVKKGIRTEKVKVDPSGNWPDYVFESHYQLPSLSEVESFIKNNKHLPDVPSAKEVEEKGLDIGANQAVLLKKIEELTLYMIDMKKENEQMKKENIELKQRIEKLENKN